MPGGRGGCRARAHSRLTDLLVLLLLLLVLFRAKFSPPSQKMSVFLLVALSSGLEGNKKEEEGGGVPGGRGGCRARALSGVLVFQPASRNGWGMVCMGLAVREGPGLQECAEIPRRARIYGPHTFVSLNSFRTRSSFISSPDWTTSVYCATS